MEEILRLEEELTEAFTNMDDNILVGADTKEQSMIIKGLLYPLFVEHGLDVDQRGGEMAMTPLHEAMRTGSFEATLALLNHGADLEVKIRAASFARAYTPLEFAIMGPAIVPKILTLLLERGAKYGHTTQSIAAIEGSVARPSVLRVLLDHDIRLVQLETRQRKIIHAAVTANQPESVGMLLERGADPNARDLKGRTPLAMQSSVNRFGTFISNGMYGHMMGKSRQLQPHMFNPEHWGEVHRLLLDYGGEEPDDYIETVGERKMMEGVASYSYWLSHFNTALLKNPAISGLLQDIVSGASPTDPTILYGYGLKQIMEHKRTVIGLLGCIHTLARVTERLPVGSTVLTVTFSANFKNYLAAWREPVNWDEFIDFAIDLFRNMLDPKFPESSPPEGLTDAILDSLVDEVSNPLCATGSLGPQKRSLLEYVWNISLPVDFDAAMACLRSPFVPELPPGSRRQDGARENFENMKRVYQAFTEDPSAHVFAALRDQLTQALRPAGRTVGARRLSDTVSRDSDSTNTSYKPSFLSDLEPPSPIYICSINLDTPIGRKADFIGIVWLPSVLGLLLLWRMLTWYHWMSISRFTSLLLLYTLHKLVQRSSIISNDFSYLALVGVWLANDRTWQFVLEYLLFQPLLAYVFFSDPYKALTRQIGLRWRHGFPDVEPLILSHAEGKEWKYDFAQLLEGLHGSHSPLTTRKGWIQRPHAISAVLDQWRREAIESGESTVKYWGNGWWFYEEGSGRWRKFNFVENSRPERYLEMYARVEEMFHSKGRPELYQQFRQLFPRIVSGETYRVMERAFAEYPDIFEATQDILFE
ncbi:MAG: hypothetical protein Q9226_006953 [Calogaya cf. arnoldii]